VSKAVEKPRPERRGFRKSVYIIPSLFTTANIFCGFSAVILSVNASVALNAGNVDQAIRDFDVAAKFIGWAVLFDFLDGRVARMTNSTTQFGVEFDSIADVLTFGIAPAMLAYCWGYGFVSEFGRLPWAISFLYLICGALRLARFNVQASKPAMQKPNASPKLDKKAFVGMPIPAGASLIAAVVHFAKTPVPMTTTTYEIAGRQLVFGPNDWGMLLLALVVCLALLMVSTFRYTAFKSVGPRSRNPRVVILVIALGLISVYYYSEVTLLLLASTYAAHGVVGKIASSIRRIAFPHHQHEHAEHLGGGE
jgi:CDP-diacylglycerol--serine O-phosphatidyltransferase